MSRRLVIAALVALALAPIFPSATSANWPVETRASYVSRRYSSSHRAVDVAARYGTPVQTVRKGTTVFAGYRRNCGGKQVYVYHGRDSLGRRRFTAYYHLSRIVTWRGERLSTGENVGKVGTSGCTTGPHVHVEEWVGYPWRSGSRRISPWTRMVTTYDRYNGALPYRYR